MEIIDEEIQRYAERHTTPASTLLEKIDRETYANVLMPRMLSGHLQGRILAMLSLMIKPKMALEIGTYTGYSALCIAEGLADGGKLITIDINEELETSVRKSFADSNFDQLIDFKVGNALDIIPEIPGPLDFVFIDADKTNYLNYYHLVMSKMKKGGFIVVDNVLWSGKVLGRMKKDGDKDTPAIIEFNQKIQEDSRVENVLLPVRDGLMILHVL